MKKLNRQDLWTLEEYSLKRPEFRRQVMAHKAKRFLALGDNSRLVFEDELTVRYQIQEMLRIEKLFEADDIEEELRTYNPLIPDGRNWKATFMLEYTDADKRHEMTRALVGIEAAVWMRVDGCERVYPICNEDIERCDGEKTSTVHFMRFELTASMITALGQGCGVAAGINHENYNVQSIPVPLGVQKQLRLDLCA